MRRQQVFKLFRKKQREFLAQPNSGGTNNSPLPSTIFEIIEEMGIQPGDKFVDLGSGFGGPCMAVNMLFQGQVTCLGVERDKNCVEYSTERCNSRSCNFLRCDVQDINADVFSKLQFTHMWAFDSAFEHRTRKHILALLRRSTSICTVVMLFDSHFISP